MNELTREAVIAKLGNLMLANAELGATNDMLLKLVHEQKAELDVLRAREKAALSQEGEGAEGNGAGIIEHQPEPNGKVH